MLVTYGQAIHDGLAEEMRRDDTVVVFGEDVASLGGLYGVTQGLLREFGDKRIWNTPITENAIAGAAVGAALTGLRPCIDMMYADFLLTAFHELFHSAGNWRYQHGKSFAVPLVVRAAMGHATGSGGEHSLCPESLFMHAPGLTVIAPSTPYDAKGLIKSAIRSDNAVIFLEHKQLYGLQEELPAEEYTLPIGKGRVVRDGSDVTIITWSAMVQTAQAAAAILETEGISALVFDVRTLSPLDEDGILQAAKKTGRVVVASESYGTCGASAEIAAQLQEKLFGSLKAPIHRVAAPDIPLPYAPHLEASLLPDENTIIQAVRSLIS
jgi:pyruvate/2-oxoglutarate/acetoin dehydrogenase E1 component